MLFQLRREKLLHFLASQEDFQKNQGLHNSLFQANFKNTQLSDLST